MESASKGYASTPATRTDDCHLSGLAPEVLLSPSPSRPPSANPQSTSSKSDHAANGDVEMDGIAAFDEGCWNRPVLRHCRSPRLISSCGSGVVSTPQEWQASAEAAVVSCGLAKSLIILRHRGHSLSVDTSLLCSECDRCPKPNKPSSAFFDSKAGRSPKNI